MVDWGFFVVATIRNRRDNWRWRMVTVYGPADHMNSEAFLEELEGYYRTSTVPILFGGDFNLIRTERDKSNNRGDKKLMDAFNNFIEKLDMKEIHRGAASLRGLITKKSRFSTTLTESWFPRNGKSTFQSVLSTA
jgi:hypothetical protein